MRLHLPNYELNYERLYLQLAHETVTGRVSLFVRQYITVFHSRLSRTCPALC